MTDGSASFVSHHPPRVWSFLCLARRTKKKEKLLVVCLSSLPAATNISLVLQNQNVLNGEEREEMAQGGYFKFQAKEMIEWGQEEKPKKIRGPKFNPQKTVKLARTSFQKLQLQWIFFDLLRWRFFVYPRLLLYFMCYLYTLLMFGGAIFIFFSVLGLQPRDKGAMLAPTWPPWRHVQTSNLVTALTVWILINFVTQLL